MFVLCNMREVSCIVCKQGLGKRTKHITVSFQYLFFMNETLWIKDLNLYMNCILDIYCLKKGNLVWYGLWVHIVITEMHKRLRGEVATMLRLLNPV